jgi:large subunit ribosomal protein L10
MPRLERSFIIMHQPRAVKEQIIKDLSSRLNDAGTVYLTDLTGLNVEAVTDLRSRLRAESIECRVIKNTLTRFAIKSAGLPDLGDHLDGPTALVISDDPVTPAKILTDFGKTHENRPRIKGGLLSGAIIDASQVEALSKLPSREELLTRAVRGIAAPISGLVFSLSGVFGNMVRVLAAVAQKREADGSGEGDGE